MRGRLIGWLMTMVVACSAIAVAAQDWTPAGSKDGVQLAFRDDADLDARSMRAIAGISHPAPRIVAVVCDFTQPLDPDVREAKIVAGDLQSSYEIYLRYAPRYVVVSARDVVISVQRHASGCSWSERSGLVDERSGTVRMPLLRGSWSVEAEDANRSRVTYEITVKPGGSIPGWLVRRGAASALPGVIDRVKRCLARTSTAGERC
jgi:hypothetical protein